jgi:hypothetical protein
MADLEALTDELYAVPPAEFVAARTAAVAAARSDGDKATATALAALRKPTVTAWLSNQLVRTHPDVVSAAIAIGSDLRDATAAGDRDALRGLARRRAQLVTKLVGHARAIADEHGQAMTAETQRELESTVTAAAVDPAAAALVQVGRLASPLTFEGFGFDQGVLPPPRDPAEPTRPVAKPRAPRASLGTTAEPPTRAASPPPVRPAARPRTGDDAARVRLAEEARARAAETAARTRAAEAAARTRAAEEAEQALAVARLQQADADAELAAAEGVLERAARTESDAGAAYRQAQTELADARAEVRDARKDAAVAARSVVAALARLERATRRQH